MTTPRDTKLDTAWASKVAALASLLVGGTAIGTALALYLGWQYEQAYVEEWGLSFSSFSYAPFQLMVASSTTLVWGAATPLGLVAGYLVSDLDRSLFGPSPPAPPLARRIGGWGLGLAIVALIVGLLAWSILEGDIRGILTTVWAAVVSLAGFGYSHSRRTGSEAARLTASLAGLGAAILLILIAPQLLGRADATSDREDRGRLPQIEITLRHPLGLANEQNRNGDVISGPWRLIRQNGGRVWLAAENDEDPRVVMINDAEVASVTYTNN